MKENFAEADDVKLVEQLADKIKKVKTEIAKVIVGQDEIIDQLLVSLFSGGHCLLVGVPGLAKTLLIKTVAEVMDLKFSRIQFTPDLMPSDITGTEIIEEDAATKKRNFKFISGPIFANMILADEINRTPPKTQAALLEAMQEHKVTAAGTTYQLPLPFFVLATQNPIEQEGTYPLPEAQVDRFMLKIKISYPERSEELAIMRQNMSLVETKINPVVSPDEILKARNLLSEVYIDEKIEKYILDIVFATRNPKEFGINNLAELISYGASPRATINLAIGAKAMAFIKRRGYVIPEDVRAICLDVMRHRVAVTYEAEAEEITSENVIQEILNKVVVP